MVVAFDLDDTLVPEMDYVRSAYRAIARRHGAHLLPPMLAAASPAEAFDSTGLPIETCLDIYRNHCPDIRLPWQSLYTLAWLKNCGHTLALITDGRSSTQRAKIEALGLTRFIAPENIYISEEFGEGKATGAAMRHLMRSHPGERCAYIGDNPDKDFGAANSLGWFTVCLLDSGQNIHAQNFESVADAMQPEVIIRCLTEICGLKQFCAV